jgi:hypothetical protein
MATFRIQKKDTDLFFVTTVLGLFMRAVSAWVKQLSTAVISCKSEVPVVQARTSGTGIRERASKDPGRKNAPALINLLSYTSAANHYI